MRKYLALFVAIALLLSVVPAFAQDDMAPTIAEIVVSSAESETPEFATLLAAVSAANPAVLEELSDPEENYTVFTPTDAAFAAALEALGVSAEDLLADTETLTQILLYHVVPGELGASTVVAVAADGVDVATALPGTIVTVTASDAGVTVNDANVIATDIFGTNGVIHVIDAVLLPPADDDM